MARCLPRRERTHRPLTKQDRHLVAIDHRPLRSLSSRFANPLSGRSQTISILSRSWTVSQTGPPAKTSTYSRIASLPKISKRSSRYDRRAGWHSAAIRPPQSCS